MALALDGSNTANNSGLNLSTTLTTTSTNDLIIAVISTSNAGTSAVTMGGGLSGWTQYFLKAEATSCSIQVYYTTSASTLSSQSITCTLGTTTEEPSTMTVFGVSGANLTTPFDSNVALPASLGKTSSTTNAVTGVSTSNANDMIVQVTGLNSTSGGFTAGTIGGNTSNLIQSSATYAGAQYFVVSSTQSSITCTANWTTARASISAVFGIQQASVVPTVSGSTLLLMGVG